MPRRYHIRNPLSNQQVYKQVERVVDNRLRFVIRPCPKGAVVLESGGIPVISEVRRKERYVAYALKLV